MTFDPVLAAMLDAMPPPSPGPLDFPALRRRSEDELPALIGPEGPIPVAAIEDRTLSGPAGPIALRVYRPSGPVRGTLHYLHGGGWALGGIATTDPFARRLCRDLSMTVVTSAYRLAPEHPFPAGHDDALAAAGWVLSNAAALGGAGRPVVIAGDSAGANLAAAVCIALRNGAAGAIGSIRNFDAQLLLYPATDLRDSAWTAYPSRGRDTDPTLSLAMLAAAQRTYAGDADPADPRLSPIAAADLSRLPPALVVTVEADALRDEGLAYAAALADAGGVAEAMRIDRLVHGFAHVAAVVPAAAAAVDAVLARFTALLDR